MGFNTLKRSALYMPPLSYASFPVVLAQFSKRFIVSSLFFFSFYVCDIADLLDKIAYAECGN